MNLSDRLREVRRQTGKTLVEVAGATALSVSYLSDLERGRTNPSLETLNRLSSFYGLSTAAMLASVDSGERSAPAGLAPGLASLLERGVIDERTAQDLNRIELRGRRPQTEDEWHELYMHLRRIMQPYLPREPRRTGSG